MERIPSSSSGLCIDFSSRSGTGNHSRTASFKRPSAPSSKQSTLTSRGTLSSMNHLLKAEAGDMMIEFDASEGLRPGARISGDAVTRGGGTRPQASFRSPDDDTSVTVSSNLSRQGTLLTTGASPARTATELKSLLGSNANGRLKHGAVIPPTSGSGMTSNDSDTITLEHAKSRARVELDVHLASDIGVQGGHLRGELVVHVRRVAKRDAVPVRLADGKVRVVGFECIPQDENDKHMFFHCGASLESVSPGSSKRLFAGLPDDEGFAEAREGTHILPFNLLLPADGPDVHGRAKGIMNMHGGVSVRYITVVSIKVMHPATNKRSIAHFYRNCAIWPHLDSATILAPATRPLTASTAKSLFMGGDGKLRLTAVLHRLHWLAGQHCCVRISVENGTKKRVGSVALTLLRTTVVFCPRAEFGPDPDACQTETKTRKVSETVLEMGQSGSKRNASARGWWPGVGPGRNFEFSHLILLPPDALSVTRGRLLEVEYSIRVSLCTGSLSSDVHVVLPIRIVNFMSIDPPPSSPLSLPGPHRAHSQVPASRSRSSELVSARHRDQREEPVMRNTRSGDDTEGYETSLYPSSTHSQSEFEDSGYFEDEDDSYVDADAPLICPSSPLAVSKSDAAHFASLAQDEADDGYARFADLYFASRRTAARPGRSASRGRGSMSSGGDTDVTADGSQSRGRGHTKAPPARPRSLHAPVRARSPTRSAAGGRRSAGPRLRPQSKQSAFALRVAEKLQQVAAGTPEGGRDALMDVAAISASVADAEDDLERLAADLDETWTPRPSGVLRCVNPDTDAESSCLEETRLGTTGQSSDSISASNEGLNSDVDSSDTADASHHRQPSRALPQPPSHSLIPPSRSISEPTSSASAPAPALPQAQSIVPVDRAQSESCQPRPPLVRGAGVASSVRDRIAELEQRVREVGAY